MAERLLDTNILLRHLLSDHPVHSPKAESLIKRVEEGKETVAITDIVIFETVYTLQSFYKIPRRAIRENLTPLIMLRGVKLAHKTDYYAVFDLYESENISFADAYHIVVMKRRGAKEIYSFDTDFDKVAGITRVEP